MEGVTILAPRSGISPKSCKKRRFQASNDSPTLPQMMAFAINTSGQLASQFTVAQGKPRSLCTRLLRHRQAIPDGLCYRRSRHQRIIFPLACQSHPSNSRTTTEPQDDEQHKEKSPFASFKTVRKVLAALSVLGVAETTYLTFIKLFSSPGAICSTEGCLDVLTGPFSTFLGIPLTVFGMLAYASFAYLCIWPLIAEDEEVLTENESQPAKFIPANEVYAARDAATRPLMLALSTASFVFTVYLMGLLVFVIHSMCPYCVFSAILSGLIFVITAFVGRAVPKIRSALIIGSASTAAAGVAAAAMFFLSLPAQILAQPPSEPQSPPQITMRSNSDTMRIAEKLRLKNTKMYGAFWCSHCYDQKQRFGKKAFGKIQYIECDKYGTNTQYQLCRQKRIPGYPTWEIGGELYPGEVDISELERLVDESNKAAESN